MRLPRRPLGPSLEPTVVVLGAMGFASRTEEEESRHLQDCLTLGVGAVDTAPLYGFGQSERALGDALRRSALRPEVYTKVGLRWDGTHGDVLFVGRDPDGTERVVRRDGRPEQVRRDVLASCERLGLERLDLVQVHQRDYQVPVDETLGALADLVREGRVGAVGVSNFEADDVRAAAKALGDLPLVSLQSPYSLLDRAVERGPLAAARSVGAGFLAYSPLAQGLLTGAHGPGRRYDADDWRASTPLFTVESRTAIAAAVNDTLRPLARTHEVGPAALALAWLLHRPGVTAVIAGASRPSQLEESLRAGTVSLSAAELARLEARFGRLLPSPSVAERVRTRLRGRLGAVRRRVRGLIDRVLP
ncbi:MAG: aldo/keto reductase [Sandaracinus sp.]|nr:aldo/keto reductase [Sandaracinus sp.]